MTKIGEAAFFHCSIKEVTIPASVKRIGVCAFARYEKLEKVTEVDMSDNITRIKSSTFKNCRKLKKINLPKKLEKIDSCAFWKCAIKEIVIPKGVEIIEVAAFQGCSNLKKIVFKGGKISRINESSFKGIHQRAVFDVPNKYINKYQKKLTARSGFVTGKMKIK